MRRVVDCTALKKVAIKNDAGANTAAVITVPAGEDDFWVVDTIRYSYDGAPTGGNLTVVLGSTTLLDLDITGAGPGELTFRHSDEGGLHNSQTKNEALTVTLAAGGAGVTGKLQVEYR